MEDSNENASSTDDTGKQDEQKAPEQSVTVFGRTMPKADIFKLAGLLAFVVLIVGICAALWPMLSQMFSNGGAEGLIQQVRDAGPLGMLILLGMEFLQVVVAFIPGEVVQVAAGMLYGPWLGALIIVVGCFISSWFIYELVHRLGQPFAEAMVPTKYLEKIRAFERSGKLDSMVFILFLIPGLPKDTFTYLVPLTEMRRKDYLIITTVARIPGILMSTYAAAGLMDGNIKQSIAIFIVIAIIAGIALFFKDKIIAFFDRRHR
jgi:uncharacterized membrane protein YdjX (TVP38/TMEM64 family)